MLIFLNNGLAIGLSSQEAIMLDLCIILLQKSVFKNIYKDCISLLQKMWKVKNEFVLLYSFSILCVSDLKHNIFANYSYYSSTQHG